jgi:hypothetical protein
VDSEPFVVGCRGGPVISCECSGGRTAARRKAAGADPYARAHTMMASSLQLRRLAAIGPSAAVDAADTAFALGARVVLAAPAPGAGWERDDSWRI